MINTIYYLSSRTKFDKKSVKLTKLKSEYVRVKNLYCGVCGGDYSAYLGRRGQYNVSLGHEFVSEIIEADKNAVGFQTGNFVVSDFNYRCGHCNYCLTSRSHLCDKNAAEFFSNRAFATYSDIHYSYLVATNIPRNIIISATCIEPLSCVIHAVDSTFVEPDIKALIVGCGNIGMLTAFYLKVILHINEVFVIDIIAQKSERLIRYFGCKQYKSDIPVDIIFEATNEVMGLGYAITQSPRGGRICSISHLYGLDTSEIYEQIIKNEIQIKFPLRNGNKSNLTRAAQYISQSWDISFNSMFKVSDITAINEVFKSKNENTYNKQIISMI